jgi:hypothetical protein
LTTTVQKGDAETVREMFEAIAALLNGLGGYDASVTEPMVVGGEGVNE